jgi:hypothetical protein
MNDGSEFPVQLHFHESLRFFLKDKSNRWLGKTLREKASVKDVIESCGLPHPEVDLILVENRPVDFSFLVRREVDIEIFGVSDFPDRFLQARLQRRSIERFVADGHLGKLARILRLCGIDVNYERDTNDRDLLNISTGEERALLTRDRRLLMHAIVRDGYYLRSQNPDEQALEVVRRFQLLEAITPFARCLNCNSLLAHVGKNEIESELEPLTKIYYHEFRHCPGCGKIYWAGSHFPKLQARVAALKELLAAG